MSPVLRSSVNCLSQLGNNIWLSHSAKRKNNELRRRILDLRNSMAGLTGHTSWGIRIPASNSWDYSLHGFSALLQANPWPNALHKLIIGMSADWVKSIHGTPVCGGGGILEIDDVNVNQSAAPHVERAARRLLLPHAPGHDGFTVTSNRSFFLGCTSIIAYRKGNHRKPIVRL